MASRNLSDLCPNFKSKVVSIKKQFDTSTPNAVTLLIYCVKRSLTEQAILYRQGRSTGAIRNKQSRLRKKGFPELAKIITAVGPQMETVKVTNAGPGESWHQYGLAVDAVPIQAGNLLWDHAEYYNLYGKLAKNAGLIWGKNWVSKDTPHIQIGIKGNPLDFFKDTVVRERLNL